MLFRPLISFAVFAISCCIITMSLSEIFGTMTEGDKLDGPNYALWSFMLRNILVGKGLRDIVSGDETRLVAAYASTSSFTTTGALASASSSASSTTLLEEHKKFDRRNAQALSLIALLVKRHKWQPSNDQSAKVAWDKLESMQELLL